MGSTFSCLANLAKTFFQLPKPTCVKAVSALVLSFSRFLRFAMIQKKQKSTFFLVSHAAKANGNLTGTYHCPLLLSFGLFGG